MLFQVIDSDGDPMGILQVSPVEIHPHKETLEEFLWGFALEATKDMYDHEDPSEHFWDTLLLSLEKFGLTAERVFMEEINL